MSFAVLDTDIVSFLFKKDTRANLYKDHLLGKILVISFMTLAELDRWSLERNWGQNTINKMEEHLKKFVLHPFDRSLCYKWAEVSYQAKRNGKPIQTADAWIAATALLHNIPLITHNKNDFIGIPTLQLISEA